MKISLVLVEIILDPPHHVILTFVPPEEVLQQNLKPIHIKGLPEGMSEIASVMLPQMLPKKNSMGSRMKVSLDDFKSSKYEIGDTIEINM